MVAPTRDHKEIRSETREQLVLSDVVGYDAVSAALASSYVAVQLPTSRAASPSVVATEEPVVPLLEKSASTKSLVVDTFIPVTADENAVPNSIPRPVSTRGKKSSTASSAGVASKTRSNSAVDVSEGI